MDLYGSWDPSSVNSGRNTPVQTSDNGASSSAMSPKPQGGQALQAEIEQMTSLVSGMSKGFGSYWGQLRKQSASAIKQSQEYATAAAKDLTPYLDKAKAELDKLGEQARASAQAGQAASIGQNAAMSVDAPDLATMPESEPNSAEASSSADGPSSARDGTGQAAHDAEAIDTPQMSAATFFSKLQTQLSSNPNFQSFQHNFTHMQDQLKTHVDFSRIDLHEAQRRAEAAMNQGEKYFKVASKDLTDLFGQAVRVVPPIGETAKSGNKGVDKRRKEAEVAAAGRRETLLHRLRSDPAALLVDPAQLAASKGEISPGASSDSSSQLEADTREAFARFMLSVEDSGGLEAELWKGRIDAVLMNETSGPALKQTLDSVVPAKLSTEAFWMRYFFRVKQIDDDEAKRKEILEGALRSQEEDFDWDLDDDTASNASEVDREATKVDIKGKGRVMASDDLVDGLAAPATPKPSSSDINGVNPTPATANLSAPTSGDVERKTSPTPSDVDESWGMSPVAGSPSAKTIGAGTADAAITEAAATLMARNERTNSSSSTRNSSEEGTSSSFDVVSARSGEPGSPRSDAKPRLPVAATVTLASTTSKLAANEDDEDSDWE